MCTVDGSLSPARCSVSERSLLSNECPSSEWGFIQPFMLMVQKSVPYALERKFGAVVFPYATKLNVRNALRQLEMTRALYVTVLPSDNSV